MRDYLGGIYDLTFPLRLLRNRIFIYLAMDFQDDS